jgi:hypothetical protein
MRIRQRIDDPEAKMGPSEREYSVHAYGVRDERHAEHNRENCPSCAAMSDQEYAAYHKWLTSQKGKRVRVIRVHG